MIDYSRPNAAFCDSDNDDDHDDTNNNNNEYKQK